MRIFLCGDSSSQIMPEEYRPLYGWGEVLNTYLPDTKIINAASGGQSSRSYVEEKRLQAVLDRLTEGDIMLIELGANDSVPEWVDRYTDPKTAYPQYLMKYINGAKERGATPVLLTSVWLRRYEGNTPVDILHEYNDTVRQLADKENVPLIDVVDEAMKKMRELPKEETEKYYAVLPTGVYRNFPDGKDDNNHSLYKGALFNAQIVADGLKKLKLV